VASNGQRFRRRALRRGYKVDEVDAFLDRVEATLNGEPGPAVNASEVHEVVFRVRFGGYDEWQVDLHLDRVERQLGELEERGGFTPARMPERLGPPKRDDRMPPRDERPLPPPMRDDRMMPPPPLRDDRMPPPRDDRPPAPLTPPPPTPGRPAPAMPAPAFGRFDEPPARFDDPNRYPEPGRFDEPTTTFGGGSFPGFEPGRHGKSDMTTEIRMPADLGRDAGPPPAAPVSGEAARIDQLRRTFVARRFGSGYDPTQVDRLFEGLIASVSGRSGPIKDAELDPGQFDLVPGGYFEAEVDQALREVRDIIRRR
jgi:DivIVA domain-containing protein